LEKYKMKFSKINALTSAAFVALAVSGNAQAFSIDIGATGTAINTGDADQIMSTNVDITEMQFNIPVNAINVGTKVGGGGVFDFPAVVGDTFNFLDSGLGNFTAPLPATALGDSEGYLSQWELNGQFDLFGTAEVTAIDAVTQTVDFDFIFTSGSFKVFYDENFNLQIDPGAQQVLDASLTSGGGDARQSVGSSTQSAGSFVADFGSIDLLDGFWLESGPGAAFLDNLTLAFTDGNINQTNVIALDANGLSVESIADGSMSVSKIPEPASLALIGLGLFGMSKITRRKKA
jgi:hypothetical protein